MELIELKRADPSAWHSTFAGGWERIRASELGLVSTSSLLDHYNVSGGRRTRLECRPRPEPEWIEADGLPPARIRDQKPLIPIQLLERMPEGSAMSVREWCFELNRRTFFVASDKPLKRLLRAYADAEHDVIVVDARELADRYEHAITLSINTGAIAPAYMKRGRGTFLLIADYPTRASGGPLKPVVEITVTEPLIDITEITARVERWLGAEFIDVVWQRDTR